MFARYFPLYQQSHLTCIERASWSFESPQRSLHMDPERHLQTRKSNRLIYVVSQTLSRVSGGWGAEGSGSVTFLET